jgi:hypothetical protein
MSILLTVTQHCWAGAACHDLLDGKVSPASTGTLHPEGLQNFVADQFISITYPSGRTYNQRVLPISKLPTELIRLSRRMKILSKYPQSEVGFREVGAFVFEFLDGTFQTLLHTLNKPDSCLDSQIFNSLFANFKLKEESSEIMRIWYLHTHPDITQPPIQKHFGAMSNAQESRSAGLPWESSIMLSELDIDAANVFKKDFSDAFGRKIPLDIIAFPTTSALDDLYFSYRAK